MICSWDCSWVAKPKNSAASVAPIGCQRPMISAASAMNPLPADVSLLKRAGVADGEERAAEPGEHAAEQHRLSTGSA